MTGRFNLEEFLTGYMPCFQRWDTLNVICSVYSGFYSVISVRYFFNLSTPTPGGCLKSGRPQRNTRDFSKEHKRFNLIFNNFVILCEVLSASSW